MGGFVGIISVLFQVRAENFQEDLVARVRLAFGGRAVQGIPRRLPVMPVGIDEFAGDLLGDYPFHYRLYGPLPGQAVFGGVKPFELIAEPPVGNDPGPRREELLAGRAGDLVQENIVRIDIAVGRRVGALPLLFYLRRRAVREALRQPGGRPFSAAPAGARREAGVKVLYREVQQREESQFRLEHILGEVGGRGISREHQVGGAQRAGILVSLAAQFKQQGRRVPADLLQFILEDSQQAVQPGAYKKVVEAEALEVGRRPVLAGIPEGGLLAYARVYPGRLGRVFLCQLSANPAYRLFFEHIST